MQEASDTITAFNEQLFMYRPYWNNVEKRDLHSWKKNFQHTESIQQ